MSDNFSDVREGIRNSAVIKNPVLFEAIGIAPVVAMAVSIKTAVMLSVISTAELVIIESFSCLLLRKVKQSLRVLIYAVLGVLINVPIFMFFNKFAPNETANVSIFLPVVAVNSLIALHCERVAVRNSFKTTLVDAISASIGYVFIVFLVGIIREVLGAGTFYSIDLKLPVKFSGLLLPFGGFLLLGFLAAFFKKLIKKRYPDEKPEAAFNLSEISDRPFDDIKAVIKHDFNPFDSFFSQEANETDTAKTAEVSQSEKPKKKKLSFAPPKKKAADKADSRKKDVFDEETENPEPRRKYVRTAYESEFDDLLAELERGREKTETADTSADVAAQDESQEDDGV